MAEEKKAYKKAKEREKTSVDKKHDPECKVEYVFWFLIETDLEIRKGLYF